MGDSACPSLQGFTVILFSRTSVEILMSCSWTVVVTAAGCPLAVNHVLNQGKGACGSAPLRLENVLVLQFQALLSDFNCRVVLVAAE